MKLLKDKVVLITGATSGIGASCALDLSSAGAMVIVSGRNSSHGAEVVSHIRESGGKACYYKLDVSDEDSISDCAVFIEKEFGKLDVLVNNAGIYPKFLPLESLDCKEFNNVIEVNTTGLVMVTKQMLRMLIESRGNIVNIASVAGAHDFSSGQGYAYAVSKAAVIKFTKMSAKVYADRIRINCVCPGIIDTPLYFNLDKTRMEERIPSHRVGHPNDVAKVVTFLASEDAAYIYGAEITVDGGLTL